MAGAVQEQVRTLLRLSSRVPRPQFEELRCSDTYSQGGLMPIGQS